MTKKLVIFFVGMVIALTIGFYLYNKPRQGVTGKNADAQVQATGLLKAYQQNEGVADKKFLNAVLIVEGQVSAVERTGASWLIFLNQQADGGAVSCLLSDEHLNAGVVKEGANITIKGRCTGYNMDVNLTDCIIIK